MPSHVVAAGASRRDEEVRWIQYLFPILLYAHVLGAIITFGPSFVFPLIARQSRAMPQGGHFAAVLGAHDRTSDHHPRRHRPGHHRPGARDHPRESRDRLLQPVVPVAGAGIVLYLIAVGYAIFVQDKAAERMVEITKGMAGGPPPGAPAGPPPELLETAAKLQRGGMILTVLLVSIVFFMVVKPSIG